MLRLTAAATPSTARCTLCAGCQVKRIRRLSTLPPGIAASIAEANRELSGLLGDDALGYVASAPAQHAPTSRQHEPHAAPAYRGQPGAAEWPGHVAERPAAWVGGSLGRPLAPEADAAPGPGSMCGEQAGGAHWAHAYPASQHSAEARGPWHGVVGAEAYALPKGGARHSSGAQGGAAAARLSHVDRCVCSCAHLLPMLQADSLRDEGRLARLLECRVLS